MAAQAPSIEALKGALSEFASAPADRPQTIKSMVHELHDEIEAALRARRTFAQIADHLTSQGVKISQSSLQAYHREKKRGIAGDTPANRARAKATPAAPIAQQPLSSSAPAGTSIARLKHAL